VKKTKRYLTLLLLLCGYLGAAQVPLLERGVADLHSYNFVEAGPMPLDGEWEFYMSELISPDDFNSKDASPKDYVDFPAAWNASSGSQNFGFATYRLKLILPKDKSHALQLPHCYSNYQLWANGQKISSNGTVGESEGLSKPQWLPKTISLPTGVEVITLVLQISNFHHAIGGIRESIIIGDRDEMLLRESISLTSNLTLVIGLGVLFFVYVFVFALYKSNAVILFAALSLIWGIRELFSNLYLAIHYLPDFPWQLAVKIEYIGLFFVMIVSMLFIGSLFKDDVNNVFKYLFCFCNLIFVCIAIALDAAIFTQFLPVYLAFAAALLVFIVYVLIRAVVYERPGVWLIMACVFLGVVVFSYDLISYQGFATFNPIIINIGYMAMFVLMAVALLFQVGIFKRSAATNILTYEDLYGGNNSIR
jgi:hypothetical protein